MTPIAPPLMQTNLPIGPKRQGKVRDVYEAKLKDGTRVTVLITTDRISAYDVVMPNGVPHKGQVLTQISSYWFKQIGEKLAPKTGLNLPIHVVSEDPMDLAGMTPELAQPLYGRTVIGQQCQVIPIECVVRGYLAGSGWVEYQQNQSVCGIQLPAGLKQCDRLPEPIFTPSTKADEGHDENISFDQACDLVGAPLMQQLRQLAIAIYQLAHDQAAEKGIILADTKFEFGLPLEIPIDDPKASEHIILIDEALTPDSSRFWPKDEYAPGRDQASFDKQYVRNYLQGLVQENKWNKQPPGPALPDDVIQNTLARYVQAFEILTGKQPNF